MRSKGFLGISGKAIVNYIYFGFYFIILAGVHLYHLFLMKDGVSTPYAWYFAIDAIGQCCLETLILLLVACLISTHLPKFYYWFFISLTLFLFLGRLIDFPLLRLMDLSFWYSLDFLMDETWRNFIEMLLASSIPLTTWAIGGISTLVWVLAVIFFFRLSEKVCRQQPLLISYRSLGKGIALAIFILFAWDATLVQYFEMPNFTVYERVLPWKTTFFTPPTTSFTLVKSLKKLESESEIPQKIDNEQLVLQKKPDLFLFVIESLREDFITQANAPFLHRFKQDHLTADLSLSNSNATQNSWFSLFYSRFPFYWGALQKTGWSQGSIPLRILKRLGYKVHVYSSSRLSFYEMDEIIFGKEHCLTDSYNLFHFDETKQPWENDAQTIQALCNDLSSTASKEGRLFIVFLESTHFGYSWPEKETLFHPCGDINYLKAALGQEDLQKVKNRYRNAIHYVDGLFSTVINTLKATNKWNEATIVVTGDHGEEFFEFGHLFHASNLNHFQTNVPIYYKLGMDTFLQKKPSLTSHMDIFPTFIHYLTGKEVSKELMQGNSFLSTHPWPFIVSGRYNASRSPYEFFIHNGKVKLAAKFSDERAIFDCQQLHVLSLKNDRDELLTLPISSINEEFQEAFFHLFAQ